MTFNKSILAVAVTVALSTPAFADQVDGPVDSFIDIIGTGKYSVDGNAPSNDIPEAGRVHFGKAAGENKDGNTVTLLDDLSKGLKIKDGNLTKVDISLHGGQDLIKGIELTNTKVNVSGASGASNSEDHYFIIENNTDNRTGENGSKITVGTGNAIDIKNSELYAYGEDYPEIISNRGEIASTDGHGISIADNSIIKGNIVNGSVAGTNDDGDYQVNAAGTITGSNAAINLEDSSLTGNIINNAGGNIASTGTGTGIKISANADKSASFTGNIINRAAVKKKSGDGTGEDAHVGNVAARDAGKISGIDLGSATPGAGKVNFTGNIINETNAQIGSIHLSAAKPGKASELAFNGEINNRGTINSIAISDGVTGNITINLEKDSTVTNDLAANATTTTNLKGGTIGTNVTNKGVFNQADGNIGGSVDNSGSFNFNGGTIGGAVTNTGKFNVRGKQSITSYTQTEGTLTVALQKDAKINANAEDAAVAKTAAANNAGFKADSFEITGGKVRVDLQNSNYVQKDDQFFVLGGSGFNDTNYLNDETLSLLNSRFVTITNVENTADGVIVTFDRKAYASAGENVSGQKGANLKVMTGTLDRLGELAASGNVAATRLLAKIDTVEDFAELLPDVSGGTVAAATGAVAQSNLQTSGRARGLASGDVLDNSGVWVQGIASKGKQDNRNNEAYDTKSHGFVLGADTELNNGLVIGGAYSYIDSESKTVNSKTDSDYHMATAYAAQAVGQILVDGQAYYAWGSNDSSRNIGATAKYDSSLYGARVGAGYQFDIAQGTRLVPTLSVDASRLSVDGYTENGVAGLKVGSQSYNRFEMGLSTELSKDYQLSKALLTPSVNLGVFHDFEAGTQNSTVAFAVAPAETFNVEGTKPEKTRYVAGAGVDIVNNGNLTVSAEYNYNWNTDGFDANSGSLKFRWDF